MAIKLDTDVIRTIALFEKITRVHPKDCIISENSAYFVVEPNRIGAAIGKNGSNIKEIRKILERNVKVFEYSRVPEEFIRNLIPGIKSLEIKNRSVTVSVSPKEKTAVIGKNGENIKAIKELLKRHLNIERLRLI